MTTQEVNDLVAGFGLPYAYYQFEQNTVQAPPFLCFFFGPSSDFQADNINFQPIRELNVELYTNRKDFALEEKLEKSFDDLHLPYEKEETFLDKERMHMTTYTMDVIITSQRSDNYAGK